MFYKEIIESFQKFLSHLLYIIIFFYDFREFICIIPLFCKTFLTAFIFYVDDFSLFLLYLSSGLYLSLISVTIVLWSLCFFRHAILDLFKLYRNMFSFICQHGPYIFWYIFTYNHKIYNTYINPIISVPFSGVNWSRHHWQNHTFPKLVWLDSE